MIAAIGTGAIALGLFAAGYSEGLKKDRDDIASSEFSKLAMAGIVIGAILLGIGTFSD